MNQMEVEGLRDHFNLKRECARMVVIFSPT
jgi:hypothetical protein